MRLLVLALAALAVACSDAPPSSVTPPSNCVDNDKDGFDSCSDCNDADEQISPGAKEKCGDSIDNNCNNQIDEACPPPGADAGNQPGPDAGQPGPDAGQPGPDAGTGSCTGTQTQPCGKVGSACIQKCSGGTFGACELPSGPVDTQNDPANCGECGNACPAPAHAAATCKAGVCGRGACDVGFFDLDGQTANGCEASCTKSSPTSAVTCTGGASTVTLSQLPVHESALGGFAGSSSLGAMRELSGGTFRNTGSQGEVSGTAPQTQTGGGYTNQGGLHSLQRK